MALNDHLELHVYSKSDPNKHLEVLNGRVDPQVMEELRGNGGGSFKISLTDPKVLADPSLLDYRNFYRFKVGDRVIGSFIGKKKKTEVVGPDAAGELYVVSGAGPRTWLEDGIVFPQDGLKATSSTSRSFNFSSQIGNWYVPTDWKSVSDVAGLFSKDTAWTETRPQNFPRIPGAKWIWGDVGSGYVMPRGKNFFRGTFTAPKQGDYTLYLAGDDRFKVYIDGQHIASTGATSDGFMSAYQTTLELRQGEHVIGVEVENLQGFGGMVAAMYQGGSPEADDNEDSNSEYLKSLLWATGRDNAMWKVLPYPTKTPGWTPGEVMLTLMDEAKARGVKSIGWYTPSFSATHDSRGVPWQTMEDWTFNVGNTLLQVLERMEELFVDGWVHNETLAFNLAEARGNDRSGYGFSTSTIVTNSFRNPEGMHSWQTGAGIGPTGFRVFDNTGTLSVVDWDPTNWKSKRHARGTSAAGHPAMRLAFEVPWKTAGRQVSVRFRVRSSRAVNANVYAVPNATENSTADRILLANINIEASTSHDLSYAFTAPAVAPKSVENSYIIVETPSDAATTFDVGDVVVVLDDQTLNRPFFSGSTPNNGLTTYSWSGHEHNSPSRMATGVINRGALVFEKGKNLQSAIIDGVGDIKNHLIVRTEESWFEKAGGSVQDYGRVESMLNTSLNVELSKKVADEVFRQKSTPEEAATYTLVETEGHVPFVDFFLGDWVLAPDATNKLVRRRVVSLSAEETDAGGILHGVEFDSVYQDFDARVRRFMEREGGSLGGSFANATSGSRNSLGNPDIITNPVPSKAFPMPPATLGGTSAAAWDPEGLQAYAKVDLYWAGVTTNVDGGLTSPSFYEVEVTRSGRNEWISAGTTGALALTIDRLAVGQSYDFRVRAFNSMEEASGYSPTFSLLTAFPNVPMSAPDKPTLSSQLGLIVVNWNGLLSGAMPPSQFRYVFIEASTNQVTWTRVGGTFNRDARTLTVANNFEVGSTWHVRLTAVDGVDLKTAPSASTSIVIKGVSDVALDQAVIEKINKASADAAQVVLDFETLEGSLNSLGVNTPQGILDLRDSISITALGGGNLIPNGAGERGDSSGWHPSIVFDPEIPPGTGLLGSFRRDVVGGTIANYGEWFSVTPGATYYFEFWIKADKPNSRIFIELRNQDGAHAGLLAASQVPGDLTPTTSGLPSGAYLVSSLIVPTVWTKYRARYTMSATSTTARVASVYFNHGAGSELTAEQKFAGLRMVPVGSLYEQTIVAQTSASGRNVIINSNGDATGTAHPETGAPNAKGDVWWKWGTTNGVSAVVKQWQWNGTAWVVAELGHETIASLDAGKIGFGEMDGKFIKANTISTEQLIVSPGNYWPDPNFRRTASWTGAGASAPYVFPVADSTMPGGNALQIVTQTTQVGAYYGGQNNLTLDLEPGAPYRVRAVVDISGTPGSRIFVYVRMLTSAGANVLSAGELVSANAPLGRGVYETTLPISGAGFGRATVGIFTAGIQVAGGTYKVGGVSMARLAGSTLIEDGAITTAKVLAGAIVSQSLASRAVSAEKMLIGDFSNLIENADFEGSPTVLTATPSTSAPGWYLDSAGELISAPVSIQTAASLPGKTLYFSQIGESGVWNTRYFDVEPVKNPYTGEETMPDFHIQARARVDRVNGLTVGIVWFDRLKAPLSTSALMLPQTAASAWAVVGGSTGQAGIARPPATARYGRVYVNAPENTVAAAAWVGHIVVRRKSGGELIVDGSVTADHILAKAIRAHHIEFEQIEGTHIKAGEIQVGHLSPLVGSTISLTGNLSIQTIADTAAADTDAVSERLKAHQQQFDFDGEALKITSPASVYSMWLTNERLSIRQNNTDLAWWSADEMYVKKFIGTVVQLAQHQLEDHSSGSGTVVRAL